MRKFSVQDLTLAALLAAVYATLTLVLPIPAFTGIQMDVGLPSLSKNASSQTTRTGVLSLNGAKIMV